MSIGHTTYSHLRDLVVTFTPDDVDISTVAKSITGSFLRVEISASTDRTNIHSVKIRYVNDGSRSPGIYEDFSDEIIFRGLTLSMKGDADSLAEKATTYANTLPKDDVAAILKEYSKFIVDGTVLDGLVAGIASYLAFVFLIENSTFASQMPFQFTTPNNVRSGNSVNYNMLQYMSLPLSALSRTASGILLQLATFVQSFINIWAPMFTQGPVIGGNNELRLALDIISGYSDHVTKILAETKAANDALQAAADKTVRDMETKLTQMMAKIQRDTNNLLATTRETTESLRDEIAKTQGRMLDDAIIRQINAAVVTELGRGHNPTVRVSSQPPRTGAATQPKFNIKGFNRK